MSRSSQDLFTKAKKELLMNKIYFAVSVISSLFVLTGIVLTVLSGGSGLYGIILIAVSLAANGFVYNYYGFDWILASVENRILTGVERAFFPFTVPVLIISLIREFVNVFLIPSLITYKYYRLKKESWELESVIRKIENIMPDEGEEI